MKGRRAVLLVTTLAMLAVAGFLSTNEAARKSRNDWIGKGERRFDLIRRHPRKERRPLPGRLRESTRTVSETPVPPEPHYRWKIIRNRKGKEKIQRRKHTRRSKPQATLAPMRQEPASTSLARTDPRGGELPLDPAVRYGTLENGLTYYIRRNKKPENRVELRLIVNAGSMQEDEDQRGLAHFVEHMAFNGTEHFDKQELIDYLELTGMRFGPDINAFTSFDETVYMLQLPTDDDEVLAKGFLILEDWAGGLAFEGEEIDKERGVVTEEWRLGRGAGARMRDKQFPVLFKDSRYAERLVIGDPEILQNAPHERLRQFYRDWYRPELMAVVVVGDIDEADMESRIRKHFTGLQNPESARARIEYPVPDHAETLFTAATDPEATTTSVSVYTKLPREHTRTRADYRRQLVESIYHGLLNDRLQEILQEPDPPFRFARSGAGSFVRTRKVLFQSAGVKEGEAERGLEALLTEVKRVDDHGFTETELERIKVNILRGYEQSYRERDKQWSSGYTWEYMSHFLEGEPSPGIEFEYDLVQELLPTITLDEVNHQARSYGVKGNRVITYNGPEKEGVEAPSEEALLAVFDETSRRPVDPYEDRVKDEPLVAQEPRPGKIVGERTIDEIGVTEWDLSNGIKIVMKPTDFRNDEIRMTAFSPGGHSLVPNSDHTSATYATTLMSLGGLGNFDAVELEKALAGKVAGAWSYISELEEGLGGRASPEDLETMFQLMYLRATAPRIDQDAIDSWMVRSREGIQNRLSNPNAVFSDRWSETLSQKHYRRRPVSLEKLDEIDVDKALRIYQDRFRDLGDFTFIFVGNFTPDSLKPHVLKWIGGLPAQGRDENWRDVGVRRPDGVVKFEVLKGLEPKSSTRMLFHGDADWTREESFKMSALASVLQIRLREILREDMGGTYGVGVGGSISRRPTERYSFSVNFGSAPENVGDMVQAVFDEIERVKAEGIEQEYIDKVREGRIRDRETSLKENGFWLNVLESYYTYGDDPRKIMDYDELVDLVTAGNLQAMARKYLVTDQYVKATLYPEDWTVSAAGGRTAGD